MILWVMGIKWDDTVCGSIKSDFEEIEIFAFSDSQESTSIAMEDVLCRENE